MPNLPWLKEFPKPDSVNSYPIEIEEISNNLDAVVFCMHRTLDDLITGTIPNSDYSKDELINFVNSLIKRQNGPDKFITMGGNWSLIPTNEGAPSDVRVALIFFPSYLAVSLMAYFWYIYRHEAEAIPHYLTTLHDGIYFITARKLCGHGIEGEEEQEEAIRILIKGRVHHYLHENLANCKKCQTLYILIEYKIQFMQRQSSFECLDLIKELSDYPNLPLTSSPHFSWRQDVTRCAVILEAPYSESPGSEIATAEIVTDVAARVGCAAIIGRVSKQEIQYTSTLTPQNENVFTEYDDM